MIPVFSTQNLTALRSAGSPSRPEKSMTKTHLTMLTLVSAKAWTRTSKTDFSDLVCVVSRKTPVHDWAIRKRPCMQLGRSLSVEIWSQLRMSSSSLGTSAMATSVKGLRIGPKRAAVSQPRFFLAVTWDSIDDRARWDAIAIISLWASSILRAWGLCASRKLRVHRVDKSGLRCLRDRTWSGKFATMFLSTSSAFRTTLG